MAVEQWAYRQANGKAKGTQDWEVENEKSGAITYTGLWKGRKVVALLVGKGFDEGADQVYATGDDLVRCANGYPVALDLLRRMEDAIEALDGTTVENEKLVDDYRAFMRKAIIG